MKKGGKEKKSLSNDQGTSADNPEEEKQPPQMNISSIRRHTVFAPSYDPEANASTTDVHQKGAEEIKKLTEAIKGLTLLSRLDDDERQQLCLAMEHRVVKKGDIVIKEGEEGDYFYVIESGTYEVSQTEKGKVVVIRTYQNKGCFGELALLYNQPRMATVTAKTDGKLWALSQKNFKKTVAAADLKKRRKISKLISQVDILQNLTQDEKLKLSEALEPKNFPKGTKIFQQGDVADGMYFVEQGQVTIFVGDDPTQNKLKTVKANEYFGELALLTHQTRAASAYAETDVILAFLDAEAFERLLGSLDSIMRRNAKTYDKQLKKLFSSTTIPTLKK